MGARCGENASLFQNGAGRGLLCWRQSSSWSQPRRNHGNLRTWELLEFKVQWPAHTGPALAESEFIRMANILVNSAKHVEIAAEDALAWLTCADKTIHATPATIAALATLVDTLEKPLLETAAAAANPLNIPLDLQTAADLVAAWPEVKAFVASLGVKF